MDKITIPNNGQSTEKVKRYTIMHEDIPVLEFNRETDEVTRFKHNKSIVINQNDDALAFLVPEFK